LHITGKSKLTIKPTVKIISALKTNFHFIFNRRNELINLAIPKVIKNDGMGDVFRTSLKDEHLK